MKKTFIYLCILSGLSSQANAFDIFHPIKSIEKAVIVGGIGYIAVQGAVDYLIKHPGKTSEWFSVHPEQLVPVSNYIDKKIENAKTQEEFNKYSILKKQMYLDTDISELEEINIQNSIAFKTLEEEVEDNITIIDTQLINSGQMPTNCNVLMLKNLTVDKDTFDNTINNSLPSIEQQVQKTYILDVNTFKKLKDGYKKSNKTITLEQDHIPSYAAIDKFLNGIGIVTKTTIRINSKGKNVTVRDKDLEANETAIATPTEIHENGRTYLGKNSSKKIKWDSENLFKATVLDITTTALSFQLNSKYNISATDYIKSAMTVYARNKMLCLYDVKPKVTP